MKVVLLIINKNYLGKYLLSIYMEEINDEQHKNSHKFYCKICDFGTSRLSHYNNHLKTKKHLNNSTGIFPQQQKSYDCEICGNTYKDRSGLHRHKKKCNFIKETPIVVCEPINNDKEKIDKLTEQVSQLTSSLTTISTALMEGKLGNTTNNNTTNNNTFNLNIFLNEKCKDAMNITDFVDQIKLQLSDLEGQGNLGYVGGISNILIKNLDELDVDKRPIHCTDPKRETLYVKNNNVWEKGETGRDNVKKAIDTITKNNTKQITEWINSHPESLKAHTPKADQLQKIMGNIGGGINDEEQNKNVNKVIKNIAKEMTIDKDVIS